MQDLADEIATKLAADVQYFAAVVGLIGVLLGSVIAIAGNLLLYYLQTRAERRRKVCEKELDRFTRLEELVGEMTEWIGSYRPDLHDPERIQRLDSLASEAGRFRRYPGSSRRSEIYTISKVEWAKANHCPPTTMLQYQRR